jgi:hypothetical protein
MPSSNSNHTPKRIRAIVVPQPVDRYSHDGHHTLSGTDRRRYEISKDDMRTMIPRLVRVPILANHQGVKIGEATASYEQNGMWYAECELDESLASHAARQRIKSGLVRCVSLQHNPSTLDITELSLCERGQRDGSNITDVLISASVLPGAGAPECDPSKMDDYKPLIGMGGVTFIEDYTIRASATPTPTHTSTSTAMSSPVAFAPSSTSVDPAERITWLEQQMVVARAQQQQQLSAAPGAPVLASAGPPQAAAQAPAQAPVAAQAPPAPPAVVPTEREPGTSPAPPSHTASDAEFTEWVHEMERAAEGVRVATVMAPHRKKEAMAYLTQIMEVARTNRQEAAKVTVAQQEAEGLKQQQDAKIREQEAQILSLTTEKNDFIRNEGVWRASALSSVPEHGSKTAHGFSSAPPGFGAVPQHAHTQQLQPQQPLSVAASVSPIMYQHQQNLAYEQQRAAVAQQHAAQAEIELMNGYAQFRALAAAPMQQHAYVPPVAAAPAGYYQPHAQAQAQHGSYYPASGAPQQYHQQQQQQPNFSHGPPQFMTHRGEPGMSVFDELGTVRASVQPHENYHNMHSAGRNHSAVKFSYGQGWERIPNVHPRAASLLNAASGNAEEFDVGSMNYMGSKFMRNNASNTTVPQ